MPGNELATSYMAVRLGYETEERRLNARACRLRPQQTSLVWFGPVTLVNRPMSRILFYYFFCKGIILSYKNCLREVVLGT